MCVCMRMHWGGSAWIQQDAGEEMPPCPKLMAGWGPFFTGRAAVGEPYWARGTGSHTPSAEAGVEGAMAGQVQGQMLY